MTARRPGRQPRKPPEWQLSYLRRAARLRNALTDKALARRLGLSFYTVRRYIAAPPVSSSPSMRGPHRAHQPADDQAAPGAV